MPKATELVNEGVVAHTDTGWRAEHLRPREQPGQISWGTGLESFRRLVSLEAENGGDECQANAWPLPVT